MDDSTSVTSDNIGGATSALKYIGNIQELIIYNTDQSSNREAIETNINNYFNIY